MRSAGHQLSQVAEMVELILCETEPGDVLLWQRVCTVWQATIEGSQKLQRLLFFMPDEGPPENTADEDHLQVVDGLAASQRTETPGPANVRHNHLLDGLLADLAHGKIHLNENRKLVPASKGRAPASWRRMFLSQPPTTRIELAVLFEYLDSSILGDLSGDIIWSRSHFTEIVDDPEGVRAGEIVKKMVKRQDQMELRKPVCAELLRVTTAG